MIFFITLIPFELTLIRCELKLGVSITHDGSL